MAYASDLARVRAAALRIGALAHETPLFTSRTLDGISGRRLWFKAENLQRTGSFKIRGALSAVLALPEERASRGVVTHSSGNFAQALALAARCRGVPAFVVMPEGAPPAKRRAVEGYGGVVFSCPPTQADRERRAAEVGAQTGAAFVHPYDDADVIAGQGTIALELARDLPDLEAVVVPVGGGGLVSGIALALRELSPRTRVIAAEPLGADDAARSVAAGERLPQLAPRTIADGLRTGLGALTWPVVRDVVDRVVTVEEGEIVGAMRLLFERMKMVVEPSGAVSAAAALWHLERGLDRVGVVLSGGNADLDGLPWEGGGGGAQGG